MATVRAERWNAALATAAEVVSMLLATVRSSAMLVALVWLLVMLAQDDLAIIQLRSALGWWLLATIPGRLMLAAAGLSLVIGVLRAVGRHLRARELRWAVQRAYSERPK
jgi:hypothetical protein